MTQVRAKILVLEHLQAVLRGLRIGPDTSVAEEAVKRERSVEVELSGLRSQVTQPELFNALGEDELPPAVGFSMQPKGGKP